MGSIEDKDGARPKRTDVGYKRPPVETRFKKGHKPAPRKKKPAPEFSAKNILWRVLQERRRTMMNGKVVWLTNSELVARRAFVEGEKGSPVLVRLLNQMMLQSEPQTEEEMPEIVILSPEETGGFHVGTRTFRERPAGEE